MCRQSAASGTLRATRRPEAEVPAGGAGVSASLRATLEQRARFYARALAYFRPDLPLVALLLALIGLSTVLGLLMAWPMAVLVDSVMVTTPKTDLIHRLFLAPLPSSRLGQIIGLAIAGLLLKFGQDLISMVRTIVNNRINYNGLMRVRCDLYRKLQALHLAYHKSQPQGDAIYRLSSDTFGCQTILQVFVSTFVAAITLTVMLWILLSRSVPLTLAALAIAPPLMTANVWFGRQLKRRTVEAKAVDAQFTTAVQRSMASIGLVQAFCREQDEFSRFHRTVRRSIAAWWRLNWQEIFYWLTVGSIFGLGGAVVFGYGGYLVWRDQFANPRPDGMTIGDLMIFTSYLGMLWDPLCKLTGIGPNIQGGVAGAERVFEVLDRDVQIADAADAAPLPQQARTLALNHVWFSYAEGRPVLRDVSATIRPGEMVAFVGSSGVGKSTLLNLLPRFYDPTAGTLTLDGQDARRVRVADLRKHVALVLQDSVLLPTTIAENIAYGRPRASMAEIRVAAELAGAASFIEALPEGYGTILVEGSQNLSGGQRQRIAIARALLTQAPIIVLDEPTSALDSQHEHHIIEALRRLKGTRTIVLVSHRISTVADCDQIFVMDEGRIVEQGTHAELLARRGTYWDLARHQMQPGPAHDAETMHWEEAAALI